MERLRSRCTVCAVAYPAKTDRASVLTAALEQVETEGVENLAIRSVASKLGLAPNALYRYFESLAAMQEAVAEEARRQMLEVMQKAAGRKGPEKTIRDISAAYLRFADQRPRVFALYLKISGDTSKTPQCARNTEFFLEQVTRVYGDNRAYEASHALWAYLHGLAVLREAGVLSAEQESASLKFGLQMWIDGAADSVKNEQRETLGQEVDSAFLQRPVTSTSTHGNATESLLAEHSLRGLPSVARDAGQRCDTIVFPRLAPDEVPGEGWWLW